MKNSISAVFVVLVVVFSYIATNNAFKITPRVIGGDQSEDGQFPYYVFLTTFEPCGAAIINDEWLITSASCLRGWKATVYFGINSLDTVSQPDQWMELTEKNFFEHPDYSREKRINDIALINLPFRLKFYNLVQPISLPTDCTLPSNIDAVIMGHGCRKRPSDPITTYVEYATLRTVSQDKCEKTYPQFAGQKSVFCAANETVSLCNGDEGGPLVTKSNPTLIGIAIGWKQYDPNNVQPQLFTNIYSYLNWIREVTGLKLPEC